MPPEPSPFAFSQIAEMNSTPADIPIPELENLRRGLAPAFAPTQQLTGQEETARALEKMRDFQARTVVQGKMNEGAIPPNSMTVNTEKGTLDIKGLSIDTYQAIMRDREELNNIRGSFAQEAARLQAQETQARSQPWAQLATALSANLAQAPNLPGWVQAAGRTAAQLNPTADQLRNQRLAVLGQQAQMSEKAGALDIAAARTLEDRAMRGETRVAEVEKQRQKLVKEAYDNAAQAIEKGPGQLDAKAARAAIVKSGATEDEATTLLAQLSNLASNVGAKFQTERSDKAQSVADAAKKEERLAAQWLGSNERLTEQFKTRMDQNEFFTQKADYNKNTAISVAEGQTIQSAFNVMNLVDKMKEAAGKGNVGPIMGRAQYMNPYRSGEWQTIKNYADALLLSGLAGKLGSGVSDRDVEVMRGIVPSGKLTQEQFNATSKVLKTVNQDNLKRMMELNPNIQTWKTMGPMFQNAGLGEMHAKGIAEMKDQLAGSYPALFGPGRSAWADRTFGPDTKAGDTSTVSGPPPGARDAGGPRQKVTPQAAQDEVATAKAAKVGTELMIMGKKYRKRGENDFVEVK